MKVENIDHLVMIVKDVETTVRFYENVLGMAREDYDNGSVALCFGKQKINLHQLGMEIRPGAGNAGIGSADICFTTLLPIERVVEHLLLHDIPIIEGPIKRRGARGQMISVFFHDPDENLMEIAHYGEMEIAENL